MEADRLVVMVDPLGSLKLRGLMSLIKENIDL